MTREFIFNFWGGKKCWNKNNWVGLFFIIVSQQITFWKLKNEGQWEASSGKGGSTHDTVAILGCHESNSSILIFVRSNISELEAR